MTEQYPHRNDEYLEKAGIPVSSSIDFLFQESVPDLYEESGPDSESEQEFGSEDPLELPPLSPKLALAGSA